MSQVSNTQNQILNHQQVTRKIRRIAFEIYEQNFEEEEIVIAGIYDTGYYLAQMILEEVESISSIHCSLLKISLDKAAPLQSEVHLDQSLEQAKGHVVVIVDDVLNTGKTLAYSLKPFLNLPIKKLQVAVLVDRNHRMFPISADFAGYELSTTVNQHIEVNLENKDNLSVNLF